MILRQRYTFKILSLAARLRNINSCATVFGELNTFLKCGVGRRSNHHEIGKLPKSLKQYVSSDQKGILYLRNSSLYKNSIYQENSSTTNYFDVIESETDISALVDNPEFYYKLKKIKFSSNTFLKLIYYIGSNGKLFSNWPAVLDYGKKHINKLNDKQLLLLLFMSVKYNLSYDVPFLKHLDNECSKFVSLWNEDHCLLVLDLWYLLSHEQMLRGNYMISLLRVWEPKLNTCSPHHLIQLLFYIGIKRNCSSEFLMKAEMALDKSSTMLNEEQIKIFCSAVFKNHYKISSKSLLEKISLNVCNVLNADHIDTSDLITLCKVLRHSKCFDSETYTQLVHQLKSGLLHKLNLVESAHLIATLANVRIYDRCLYCLLENHAALLLKKENSAIKNKTYLIPLNKIPASIKSRPKDVAKILWSFAETAHSIKNNIVLKNIVENTTLSYEKNLFQNCPHYFLDSLTSLAVLGHFPENLINIALSSGFVKKLEGMNRAKPLKQLIMLDQSIKIETKQYKGHRLRYNFKSVLDPLLIKELNDEKQKRPLLQKLINTLNNANIKGISGMTRILPHIPISGLHCLTDTSGRLVSNQDNECILNQTAVEVLDSHVCLHSSCHPCGFMNMKLRQLHLMGFQIIKVFSL